MNDRIITFNKIKFYNWSFLKLFKRLNKGGYLVAPAASALTNLYKNEKYHNALIKSDIAILDSGFFCILLRIFKNINSKKFSGYLFLKKFLNINFKKNTKFLLIDPSSEDSKENLTFLKSKKNINIKSYIAPFYKKKIQDKKLIKLIKKFRPKYIIINLGGEVQEILALYIKNKINFKVSTICTGAAIAFLTKRQAPINDWIDKYYLGWVLRLIYNPNKHLLRTIKSLFLIKLFINFRK